MKTYHFMDKHAWGPGQWQEEPDKKTWVEQGYACMIRRNSMGALCGYVGVPSTHPAYKVHYLHVNAQVHGGLTYSDFCSHDESPEGVCHVPEDGQPDDVWWLGFDCAHSGDYCPAYIAMPSLNELAQKECWRYRDMDYVEFHIEIMINQLEEMKD